MNYRHIFHAGNFADVFKHAILTHILLHLNEKPQPYRVIDTHAGAGLYDLMGALANRTGEWRDGVGRLLPDGDAPAGGDLIKPLLDAIAAQNRTGKLRIYPGSPAVALSVMRPQDHLTACELEPHAAASLARNLHSDKRAKAVEIDAYTALKAYLPPAERRGLVLIDPPFEATDEYERLLRALGQGVKRFATGCYAVWYPIKDEMAGAFVRELAAFKPLILELRLDGIAPGKLAACGLAVINPPWRFEAAMREALPWIAKQLGPGVSWAVDSAPATPAAPASAG